VVYLTYTITDMGGGVLEQCDIPVGYVHGAGSDLFEKIKHALTGHNAGDVIQILLEPHEGFGEAKPELRYTDDLDNVPLEYRRVGAEVEFENERGEVLQLRVTRIEDGKLTLDANHPYAGQTVIFRVQIVAIRDTTVEEIANGIPAEGVLPLMH
jgi:FKBP-type peptidyl-prolyl cis-trans isomerase SlyD